MIDDLLPLEKYFKSHKYKVLFDGSDLENKFTPESCLIIDTNEAYLSEWVQPVSCTEEKHFFLCEIDHDDNFEFVDVKINKVEGLHESLRFMRPLGLYCELNLIVCLLNNQ